MRGSALRPTLASRVARGGGPRRTGKHEHVRLEAGVADTRVKALHPQQLPVGLVVGHDEAVGAVRHVLAPRVARGVLENEVVLVWRTGAESAAAPG